MDKKGCSLTFLILLHKIGKTCKTVTVLHATSWLSCGSDARLHFQPTYLQHVR